MLLRPPLRQISETVRVSTFLDFGGLVNTKDTDLLDPDELRYSTGVGVSWLSPVGALTVSYAIPFNTDAQDEKEEFQFTLGTTF